MTGRYPRHHLEGWTDENGKSRRRCEMHNMWMRKGQCEMCRLRLDEIQRENELRGGANKPPVVIKKG